MLNWLRSKKRKIQESSVFFWELICCHQSLNPSPLLVGQQWPMLWTWLTVKGDVAGCIRCLNFMMERCLTKHVRIHDIWVVRGWQWQWFIVLGIQLETSPGCKLGISHEQQCECNAFGCLGYLPQLIVLMLRGKVLAFPTTGVQWISYARYFDRW